MEAMGFFADIECKIHIDAYRSRLREVVSQLTPTFGRGFTRGRAPSIMEEAL